MATIITIISGCLIGVGISGYITDALVCANKHECRKDIGLIVLGLVILFGSLFLMALL